MKYKIEFELPDNDTVLKEIKHASVGWQIWGYSGIAKAVPSIDEVKVVRCKDCFYHGDFDENGYCVCECTGAGMPMYGFCSDGKRKMTNEDQNIEAQY